MTAGTAVADTRPTLRRRARRWRRRIVATASVVWLRCSLAVLQAVAPSAADRRALDLWCTLPPGAERRRDLRPGPGELVRLPAPRGGDVVAESWGAGPVVLLVHGWGGWRGQLGAFVRPLVDAGYRVVALDAPGHGDAAPGVLGAGRGMLPEIVDALEVADDAFGPVSGVVAHSLGCTATGLALRGRLSADRVALVAPSSGIAAVLEEFSRAFGLSPRTVAHLRAALEEIVAAPVDAIDLVALGAGRVPDTLVVHDRADSEIPYSVGVAVAEAWSGARLVTTDGLGHHRLLADPGVVEAVVEHVAG
ncbi:alpha/beta fold hydrolase [Actinotalea sp. M2MS4P-6]|uniref:alpha/beta hydrolase n=1 Tax=Actinotalea sp. M2MS4P-6 TaxID=2983762 RepID=UPI0021E4E2CC|nr:alpha/beta fold hydrolase [Actinotalea sp. M2MS4P-6]MCV2393203.1 alpha/beta fold hydrolase [Actinotalea sp. M2MS4P-6]